MKKKLNLVLLITAVVLAVLIGTMALVLGNGGDGGDPPDEGNQQSGIVEVIEDDNPIFAAISNRDSVTNDNTKWMYANLIANYYMDKDEQLYLAGLINEGYDAEWLADIYVFWIDCCEDITVIKDIYDSSEENSYFDKYWIEETYNGITQSVHGVMDFDQIKAATSGGMIAIIDVLQANVLSRKGTLTIQEVVDKLNNAESYEEIISEIYNTPLESIGEISNPSDAARLFRRAAFEGKDVKDVSREWVIAQLISPDGGGDSGSGGGLHFDGEPEDPIIDALLQLGIDYTQYQGSLTPAQVYNAYLASEQLDKDLDWIIKNYTDYRMYNRLINKEVTL